MSEVRALGERIDHELPYVWAEVEFAATHDLARTVEDVLGRRVPLLLVSRATKGLGVCERRRMLGQVHGWCPRNARDARRVSRRSRAQPTLA